jgi:hypothetical protein
MSFKTQALAAVAVLVLASPALAGATCGFSRNASETTRTTLVVNYNVSGCPAFSEPAGAKARICIEKDGTKSFVCHSYDRSNAPTVGTETGQMRFIGLQPGTGYRAKGYYAKKTGDNIRWVMTNSVILRTKK